MNILLTGHKGFVGNAIYKHIIKKDEYSVTGYDLPESDIRNVYALFDKVKESDLVLHVAAVADLYKTASEMQGRYYINDTFDINTKSTYVLGRICAGLKKTLIYISTCCVYGNVYEYLKGNDNIKSIESREIIDEYSLPCTNEPYAASKLAGENVLMGIPGLNYVILRIGTVYGVNMRESLFNYVALDKVNRGEVVSVNGDGSQTRKYIYIDDLVRGIYEAVTRYKDISKEVINMCGNEEISVNETLNVCGRVTGVKPKYVYAEPRMGEIYKEKISNGKACKKLGWMPDTGYEEGMLRTYQMDSRFINKK